MARHLLDEANSLDRPISLRNVMQSASAIKQTHEFFLHSDKLDPFSFTVQKSEQLEAGEYPALFVSTFRLGDDVYAYALKLELVLEKLVDDFEFRSTMMTPLHISRIENDEAALKKFAEHTAKLTGSRITVLPSFKNLNESTVSPLLVPD